MRAILILLRAAICLATSNSDTADYAESFVCPAGNDEDDAALSVLQYRALKLGHGDDEWIGIDDPGVRIVGRHRTTRYPGQHSSVDFDFPGVSIQVRLSNSSWASAVMRQTGADNASYVPNGFAVYVNSVLFHEFNTSDWFGRPNVTVPLVWGLNPDEVHHISIVKFTEGQFNLKKITPNYVSFFGFQASNGAFFAAAPTLPARRLEFLGDSITAGDCNLCKPNPVNATPSWDNEDQRRAWPTLICQSLGAQCHVEAMSGYGLTIGCCKQPMSVADHMANVWFRSLGTDQALDVLATHKTPPENLWDFAQWTPDAVIINLGTNDVMGGWRKPISIVDTFNATYVSLVQRILNAYGASTHIVLACGPMTHKHCSAVQWVVEHSRASFDGLKISYLDQTHFLNGTYGPRCCYHPSGEVHAAMATAGAQFIGRLLGWDHTNVKV